MHGGVVLVHEKRDGIYHPSHFISLNLVFISFPLFFPSRIGVGTGERRVCVCRNVFWSFLFLSILCILSVFVVVVVAFLSSTINVSLHYTSIHSMGYTIGLHSIQRTVYM